MKKLLLWIMILFMLLTSAVFAFAEEEEDYEVIRYWNRITVDFDPSLCDAGRLEDALIRSGFTDRVWAVEGSAVYTAEPPEGVGGFVIDVRAPWRENSENILALLKQTEGVLTVCQPTKGCAKGAENDDFTFEYLNIVVDLSLIGREEALRELRGIPFVRSAEDITGEGWDHYGIIVLSVACPFAENGPAVMNAVKKKEYVTAARFDPLAIAGPETGNTVFPYGDVNRDGQVGTDDARTILRFSVLLERPKDYLVQILADMDSSGSVTAADARLALRTAVGLNAKNYYTFSEPKYAGLIAGKSLELTKKGDRLLVTASTTGANSVTKCGFTYVKLQKLANGVWTDLKEYTYRDQFNSANAKVFSVSVAVPKGYTYRAVCEHYAEAPYLQLFTQSASYYNTTNAVIL